MTARALARRVPVALALSEALALCGRFADGVAVLEATLADCESEAARRPGSPEAGQLAADVTSLQAALLHTARWDLGTRPVTRALLERLQERAARDEPLDPRLHAAIAIELAAAGVDRDRAVAHARQAIQAMPRLISVASTALPETVLVLLFADLADEARAGARAWLALAQDRGWPVAAAMGASVAALVALYRGEVGEAAAYGQQALAGSGDVWISIDRGRVPGPRPGRPRRARRGAGGADRPRPGRRAGPDLAIRGPGTPGAPCTRRLASTPRPRPTCWPPGTWPSGGASATRP